MTKEQLYQLYKAYRDGGISDDQLHALEAFIRQPGSEHWLVELMDSLNAEVEEHRDLEKWRAELLYGIILKKVNSSDIQSERRITKKWLAVGAVAALLLLCFNFLRKHDFDPVVAQSAMVDSIMPGKASGSLLLANGDIVDLEQMKPGSSIEQDGYTVTKSDDGTLNYSFDSKRGIDKVIYNTIITPKGGEYKLELPDGSGVWVNSDSKLKYPLNFSNERTVELEGEAFFDVVKMDVAGKSIPFKVKTGKQQVLVLGTSFNINAYDPTIETTLVEGLVKLNFDGGLPKMLKPNQQASFRSDNGEVSIESVDPYYITAWRNGSFAFDKANLYDVMDVLARWYDVSVVYEGDFREVRFSGTISKYEDINKLLNLITLTGNVQFDVKGRRIQVMN